jgi:H+/gluconate symporter-like permease
MSHAEAVGCLTANLALPGAGSLAAGKGVGYAQLVVAVIGVIVSVVSCATAFRWFLLTGGQSSETNPETNLIDLWRHIRWPLFGMGIFLIALIWALLTGLQILSAHPKDPVPPRIA